MSNENPTPPAAPEPHQPVAPQPSATQPAQPTQPTQPYQPPVHQNVQYAPASARPPLTKRAKTGATWAGIVGFNLITFGFFVFIVPLLFLLAGGLIQVIASAAIRQGTGDIPPELLDAFDGFNPALWVVPLLVISAVGLVIWFVGLIVSKAILRSSGAVKPWGITWAATGIAVVVYWIVWTIIGFISGIVTSFIGMATQSLGDAAMVSFIGGVVSLLLTVIINSVIGWLIWLWMAHAMRPTQQQLATQE